MVTRICTGISRVIGISHLAQHPLGEVQGGCPDESCNDEGGSSLPAPQRLQAELVRHVLPDRRQKSRTRTWVVVVMWVITCSLRSMGRTFCRTLAIPARMRSALSCSGMH